MRPDFLVIGAMKAGTTSLYHYLGGHPEVCASPTKEIRFFSHHENWSRGTQWYEGHFSGDGRTRVAGEASTEYSMYPWYPDVPKRVASLYPDMRLIYIIREPIARMRSHYAHQRVRGREQRPIEKALLDDPLYTTVSSYALQLEQYLAYFPPERILVVDAGDLRTARRVTLERVFGFLGVSTSLERDEFDEERNLTEAGHPRKALKRMYRLPGYVTARKLAHAVLGDRVIARLAYRRVGSEELALPPSTENELRDRLASDQEELGRLLPRLGPRDRL
jgi:Sulfotransferase domain